MRFTSWIVIPLVAAGSALVAQQGSQPKAHPDHMEHRFDNPEAMAKRFDDPARDAWQVPERVIATLALKPGDVVADLGAGTGYFSVRLARATPAPKVLAVDIEPAMVAHLRQRAEAENLSNIVAVQGAADSSNLPEPVDLVLIVDTYHHIGDRVAYFRKMQALLKPAGRIAIIDFRPDSPDGPPAEFRFSPERFKAEMSQAGYRLASQHDFLPRQYFLVFEVERAPRRR